MPPQPCGCSSHELAWPYDHDDFDPIDTNGLHCGEDENDDTIMWAYPGPEHGCFVARKALASGIGDLDFVVIPGPYTEEAGAALFTSGVFTAPRPGIYAVTWSFEPSNDAVADGPFDFYGMVSSNYAAWGNPYLKDHDNSIALFGGGVTVSGDLPCLEGGTLTYEVFHTNDPTTEFKDIYASAFWKCPIPA